MLDTPGARAIVTIAATLPGWPHGQAERGEKELAERGAAQRAEDGPRDPADPAFRLNVMTKLSYEYTQFIAKQATVPAGPTKGVRKRRMAARNGR
jgi:hypothetical protein